MANDKNIFLLKEEVDIESIENEIIEESTTDTVGAPVKQYYIKGPFLQAEVKNGNGRIYPKAVCEKQVQLFNEKRIQNNRAIGELGHPETTEINLDRVSHLIKELVMENNIGVGKALIVDTPMGKIAKSLIDAGVKLGVSTRGVGTLKNNIVQDNFRLITVDIVADPSAPAAFVEGILESKKEWILENGILVEKEVEDLEEQLENFDEKDIKEAVKHVFQEFMNKLVEKA